TLSLVLGTQGPNLGLGGGIHAASEGLLTAFSWLRSGLVPGVWVAFTGWWPEYQPDSEGRPVGPAECLGMALALVPMGPAANGRTQIRLVPTWSPEAPSPLDPVSLDRRLARNAVSADRSLTSPSPRVTIHEAHAGSVAPRPHLERKHES